jgi:hypothetical protein
VLHTSLLGNINPLHKRFIGLAKNPWWRQVLHNVTSRWIYKRNTFVYMYSFPMHSCSRRQSLSHKLLETRKNPSYQPSQIGSRNCIIFFWGWSILWEHCIHLCNVYCFPFTHFIALQNLTKNISLNIEKTFKFSKSANSTVRKVQSNRRMNKIWITFAFGDDKFVIWVWEILKVSERISFVDIWTR